MIGMQSCGYNRLSDESRGASSHRYEYIYTVIVREILEELANKEREYGLPGIITSGGLNGLVKNRLKRNPEFKFNPNMIYHVINSLINEGKVEKYTLADISKKYCCKKKNPQFCAKGKNCSSRIFPSRFLDEVNHYPRRFKNRKVLAYTPLF